MDSLVTDNDETLPEDGDESRPEDRGPDVAASGGTGSTLTDLGVHETSSLDAIGAEVDADRRGRGLFVRGSGSTSWIVRLTSGLAWALALIVLSGVGFGLYMGGGWAWDAMFGEKGDPALIELADTNDWLRCMPGNVDDDERLPGLEQAPDVAIGARRFPRDPEEIASIDGASTHRSDGDRIDRFQPGSVQLAVRYHGETARVRHLTVQFPQSLGPCDALERLALLPGEAVFRIAEGGYVVPEGGEVDAYFRQGGLVRMQLSEQGVRYLRLRSRDSAAGG